MFGRAVFSSLFIILAASFPPDISLAASISPNLAPVLAAAGPDADVAIIITLTDKADISQIKEADKRLRRSKIRKELEDKAALTQGPLKAFLASRNAKKTRPFWIINAVATTIPKSVLNELLSFPGIVNIALDAVISAPSPLPQVTPATAPAPPYEWNITAVKAPDLWNLGFTGSGIVVANMDTGVDYLHADLNAKWRGGANSWFNPYAADCVPIPNVLACLPCDQNAETPCDAYGHGTGTMGVMVGGNATGTAIGVAPDAEWIAVKIFADPIGSNSPRALESAAHAAFQWLLDPDGNPATNDAPDVVNASWGGTGSNICDLTFQPDIQTLRAAGIAVVFSAGNSGPGQSSSVSPANDAGSFAVGATDINSNIASFSSRGPSACADRTTIFPNVVAPGENIKLADLTSGGASAYIVNSGTSFAAPHVAGAMALLLGAFPGLTVPQLETAIEHAAGDLGAAGADNDYGYGLLDPLRAFNVLSAGHGSTLGLFDPAAATFYMRNTNDRGVADVIFRYGPQGSFWKPVAGDWDGVGGDSIGLYDPVTGTFYLRNSNTTGVADITPFRYGPTNSTWIPLTGDWDGVGGDSIGLYNPTTGTFYLRDSNSTGVADVTFMYGLPAGVGWLPLSGNWDQAP